MQNLLQQPFPFLHQKKYLAIWLTELLVFVTLFEYAIEPFTRNYQEHLYDYWIICVFHSLEVTLSYLLVFSLLHFFRSKSKWLLVDELTFVACLLFVVGLGNFFIRDLIYDADNWRWSILWEEMIHGWLAGSLFYFLMVQINKYVLIHFFNSKHLSDTPLIHIEAQVAADSFETDQQQILCIKSDGNYVIFYLAGQGQVQEKMIRQTLDNIEKQLSQHPDFQRSHRAFIVNKKYILRRAGNAAGYQLSIAHVDFTVPVSRTHIQQF